MAKWLPSGFWTISKKLLVFLLLIFLPASGIIVASGFEHREDAIMEAENRALMLAQSLAAQQEKITSGTKQMLSTLAQFPPVKRLGTASCNELFAELIKQHPSYSIIGLATPGGDLIASAPPSEPGLNISDRKYVKDVIRTREFSTGEFMVGRVTNLPAIGFAYPVLDGDYNLVAILAANMRLDEYANFLREANLPEQSVVTILDHKGKKVNG